VRSLSEAVQVLRAILDSDTMRVVNMKNRFSPDYDAAPSGGYVHALQLLTCSSRAAPTSHATLPPRVVFDVDHNHVLFMSHRIVIMLQCACLVRLLVADLMTGVLALSAIRCALPVLFCCADANFADIRSIASQVS
jgi:hypothetical protein